jgi:hypothetical protein
MTPLVPPILAEGIGSAIFWCLLAIGAIIIGYMVVTWVKRWSAEPDVTPGGIGFSLGDLRELHAAGKMTDAEFEKAKGMMLGAAKQAAARQPHPLDRPGKPYQGDRGGGPAGAK